MAKEKDTSIKKIQDMIDLFYANKHLNEKLAKPNEHIFIDRHKCIVLDRWIDGTAEYTLAGNLTDNGEHFQIKVIEKDERVKGTYHYETSEKVSRSMIEDLHLNNISEVALNNYESEMYERLGL